MNFVTERFAIKRGVQYCRNQLLLLKPYSLRADYMRFRSDSVSIYLKKFGPNSLFLDLKMVFHGYCCFFPSKSIFLCLEIYPGSKKINLMRTLKLLAFFVHTYSPQWPPSPSLSTQARKNYLTAIGIKLQNSCSWASIFTFSLKLRTWVNLPLSQPHSGELLTGRCVWWHEGDCQHHMVCFSNLR